MATTQLISEAVLKGRAYYIVLLDEYLVKLRGGGNCTDHRNKLLCLKKLIRGLQWDLAKGINNEVTTAVYERLVLETNDYYGSALPTGENVVIPSITIVTGIAGPAGKDGKDGLTAYQLAVMAGFSGSVDEWLASLKGKSAYQSAVDAGGFEGTEAEWVVYLQTNERAYVNQQIGLLDLQKVTDVGNFTDQDIIFKSSDAVFDAPIVNKMAISWVSDGLSSSTPPANLNIIRSPGLSYIDPANLDIYIPDMSGARVLKFNIKAYKSGNPGVLVAGTGVSQHFSGGTNVGNILETPFQVQKVGNDLYVMDVDNRRLLKYTNGDINNISQAAWAMQGAWRSLVKANGDIYMYDNSGIYYLPAGTAPNAYDGWIYNNSIFFANNYTTTTKLVFNSQGHILFNNDSGIRLMTSNTKNTSQLIVDLPEEIRVFTLGENDDTVYYIKTGDARIYKRSLATGIESVVFGTGVAGTGENQLPSLIGSLDYVGGNLYYMDTAAKQVKVLDGAATVSKLPKGLSINDRRILTEDDIIDTSPFAAKTQIDDINNVRLPGKVDKDASQTAGRVIFVGPDGKLIGQGNFTFDISSGQLKVNTTASNSNYKALIGGGLNVLSGAINMEEFQSVLYMSGGRCALLVDGNGMHYRLFNNDNTDFPDTSKSFVWRNKGFVHFKCYTQVLSTNGAGQPTAWRQINEFQKFVAMPDLPTSSGGYQVVVRNNATKELELVNFILNTRDVSKLPLIDNEDLSGLDDYDEYRTSGGFTKYKLPTGTSTFTSELTNELY